jgi:hypothetical protein
MLKALLITGSLCLAVGTIGGYWLQKLESQPVAKPDTGEAVAANDKPKQVDIRPPEQVKRSELLQKYALCTNSRIAPNTLNQLDLKALNDLVYSVCTQAS